MNKNKKLTTRDIAFIGMAIAVIEVCKIALQGIPNVETTTFWIIMFTLILGRKMLFVIPAFILIEGCIYGFGLWWIMYIYAWPLLAFIAWCVRKTDSVIIYSLISGFFGLFFGTLCTLPYLVTGGAAAAFAYWVSGLGFDITH
ncbi:MAG: hypothetical protein IJ339_06020, partial [Oscillospiraceae bacterium]|nr:hypothetical protein [Oscillospiraceae bacterium]